MKTPQITILSKVPKGDQIEKTILRLFKKFTIYMICVGLAAMPLNLIINEGHNQKVKAMSEVYEELEFKYNEILDSKEEELNILQRERDKKYKIQAIEEYMESKGVHKELIKLVPLLVTLCDLYDIDPFRPASIMILETGYGTSKAMHYQNNIAGMNWTSEQKEKIGIVSDRYNIAVEKTREASVVNLVMLLVDYKGFDTPRITLSEIQPKYAPSDDDRNGLDGMDNTKWLRNTTSHYYEIEKIYNKLKGGR